MEDPQRSPLRVGPKAEPICQWMSRSRGVSGKKEDGIERGTTRVFNLTQYRIRATVWSPKSACVNGESTRGSGTIYNFRVWNVRV